MTFPGGERALEVATVAVRDLEGGLVLLRNGEITNDQFKPARTVLGVYGQRQPEQYMVRVRIPYGRLTSAQLRRLAQIGREHGNGSGHLTTRQNMQLHQLKLDSAPAVLRSLAEVGLTSLQSGGNSVRNIAACPLAGVCRDEAFDVTPYADLLNRHYLGNPRVRSLPRKVKIGLSGCARDCAFSAINDLGAIAVTRKENGRVRRGFRVVIGGGLGTIPVPAQLLSDFLPEEDLLPTCEALVRLFDRTGDRKNKQRARFKFVLQRLGLDEVKRLLAEELQHIAAEGTDFPGLAPNSEVGPARYVKTHLPEPGFDGWRAANVVPQRQRGYSAVFVAVPLGNLTSAQMEAIATVAEDCGAGEAQTTNQQDLVLCWIHNAALPEVHRRLAQAGLTGLDAEGLRDVTSCPGTTACSLALTCSPGLARQLMEVLKAPRYQEDEALSRLRIKVSGCPDSCGHHHLGDIGFYGCAVHDSSRLYPAYQMLLGGGVDEHGTRLGRPVMKLPARKTPAATAALLDLYLAQRQPGEAFHSFVERVGLDTIRDTLAPYTAVPPPSTDVWNFIDWDSTRMYIVQRGEGECAV